MAIDDEPTTDTRKPVAHAVQPVPRICNTIGVLERGYLKSGAIVADRQPRVGLTERDVEGDLRRVRVLSTTR